MSDHTRESLAERTVTFLAAFNDMDLNGVMSHFADDGIYEEFNGRESKGHDAVRAALTPQFDGVFGDMKFIDEDLMIDAETGKKKWEVWSVEVKDNPGGNYGYNSAPVAIDNMVVIGTTGGEAQTRHHLTAFDQKIAELLDPEQIAWLVKS